MNMEDFEKYVASKIGDDVDVSPESYEKHLATAAQSVAEIFTKLDGLMEQAGQIKVAFSRDGKTPLNEVELASMLMASFSYAMSKDQAALMLAVAVVRLMAMQEKDLDKTL